ncbi:MAG: type II secretion system protein [Rhodocyclaceae bacterium]|nr:type II secretion system protein [Rhodocyclaceae bacterium]
MRRQTGFSKFEFAVVLAIFGVLATILLDRLTTLEQETERLEVELTVRHINTGIKLAVADAIMRGEEARIAGLIDENPLNFLDLKVGAGRTTSDAKGWNYNPATHALTYHPRQPEAFTHQQKLAWRLQGHTDELGRSVGLRLEPVH